MTKKPSFFMLHCYSLFKTNLFVRGPIKGLEISCMIAFDANRIPTLIFSLTISLCLWLASVVLGFIVDVSGIARLGAQDLKETI